VFSRRKSARLLVFLALISWGVLASLTGLIGNFWLLAIVRFLLGVAESFILPAMLILLTSWFTRAERSRTNTLLIKTPEGVVFSQTLAGPITRFLAWLIDFLCMAVLVTAINWLMLLITVLSPGTIYYAIWIAVLISAVLTMNLLDSRTGRAIRALRRGHIAAEAFGVRAPRAKLLVFIYAAVLAGLSGWLYAHFQRAANPTPFGAQAGIEYLFIAVVGGAGYVWGGVLGAGIVVVLKEILQSYLPYIFGGQSQLETIVFGILLVLLLQLAPTGVWPWLMARLPFKPERKRPDPSLTLAARVRPEAASKVLLQIDRARKQFGGVIAVNDVSFDVQAREIVALIGPNGAGKSTTFNLITGVLTSSGGHISVLGRKIDNAPPQEVVKLGLSRTFQHVKLVPDMTVLENVAIGAHLRGHAGALSSMFRLDRADEAKLLAEAARQIERVGLADQIDQLAGSLSLGQQRIVEIARALCVDPMLLLLDEPAAGLRHLEKQRLAALLRQLRDGGMSVLLVEHDMGFVMDLADRIVVLDFGTKIAEGTPAAIKKNPDVIKAYLGAVA